MDRRTLLKRLVQGMGLAVASVVGVPAAITTMSPTWRYSRDGRWQSLGPLSQFPVGAMTRTAVAAPRDDWARSLRRKGVYVWRPDEQRVVVYSRSCTDLSCPVTWDAGSGVFFCPCHGGMFNREGQVMAGPPSRPLYQYAPRVVRGELWIDLDSLPRMT